MFGWWAVQLCYAECLCNLPYGRQQDMWGTYLKFLKWVLLVADGFTHEAFLHKKAHLDVVWNRRPALTFYYQVCLSSIFGLSISHIWVHESSLEHNLGIFMSELFIVLGCFAVLEQACDSTWQVACLVFEPSRPPAAYLDCIMHASALLAIWRC